MTGRTGDERVLNPMWAIRGRSPEVALAVATHLTRRSAEFDVETDRVRALVMLVGASCRVGRGFEIAAQAVRALRWAQAVGAHELEHLVRIDLAGCARALDAMDSAAALLRPVLDADPAPGVRAAALVEASLCLARSGQHAELDYALTEADRLYADDDELDADGALLQRARVRAAAAVQHRRRGDARTAAEASREGEHLLAELGDRGVDDGSVRARLCMERALAMLDVGATDDAVRGSVELIQQPVRAPAAPSVNWLRFALASRVYLPARRLGRARELLLEACASAQRHRLSLVLVGSHNALAEVEELQGNHAEALQQVRSAQAARTELQRGAAQARQVLVEDFPPDEDHSASLIATLARAAAKPTARGDKRPGGSRSNGSVLAGSVRSAVRASEREETPAGPAFDVADFRPSTVEREPDEQPSRHGNGLAAGRWAGPGGVTVTEGSGGRRRAPESDGGGKRRAPEPADDGPDAFEPTDESPAGPDPVSSHDDSRELDRLSELAAGPSEEPDGWAGSRWDARHDVEAPASASVDDASLDPAPVDPAPVDDAGTFAHAESYPRFDPAGNEPEPDEGPSSGTYEQTKSEVARWLAALTGGDTGFPAAAPDSSASSDVVEPGPATQPDHSPGEWPQDHPESPSWGVAADAAAASERAERRTRRDRGVDAPIPLRRTGRNRRERGADSREPESSFDTTGPGDATARGGYPEPNADPDTGYRSTTGWEDVNDFGRGRQRADGDEPAAPSLPDSANGGTPTSSSADDLALGDLLTEAMLAYHNGASPGEGDYASRFQERAQRGGTETRFGWPEAWPEHGMDWPEGEEGVTRGGFGSALSTSDSYGESGGGAHAGGRRPDTEWRFVDREFRPDR